MSGYRGHILGAVGTTAVYVAGVNLFARDIVTSYGINLEDWQLLIGLFVIAVLFALWPDVDTNSIGQNIFFGVAFVADVLLIATGKIEAAAYLGLLAMTPILGKHRGWTHSRLAMLLVPLPIILVPYLHDHRVLAQSVVIYGAALCGYFSHLLLDGLIFKKLRFKD